MNNFKSSEINLSSKRNLQLSVCSRRGVQEEEIELSNFVFMLDAFHLSEFLIEILYDSKADICTYEFKPMPEHLDDHIKTQVDRAASLTISQYINSWGSCAYGAPMEHGGSLR